MKKIFCLLFVSVLFMTSAFAYTYPRWKSMPVHVYIPPNCGKYTKLMQKAFYAWEYKTGGIVKFKYVSKKSNSNIYVEFVNDITDCNSDAAVGCTHPITNGRYLASPCRIEIETGRSNNHLYGTMIHEVGHALGLNHSSNSNSVMYPYDLDKMQQVTDVDLDLIKKKYR